MEPEERPTFKQLRTHLDSLLAVLEPNAYISFSDIDVDKLLHYDQGCDSDNAEGPSDVVELKLWPLPELFDNDVGTRTLASMAPETADPQTLIGAVHGAVPDSSQSCAETIKGGDETHRNDCDDEVKVEPSISVAAVPAHGSSSTIRDDSDDEETAV